MVWALTVVAINTINRSKEILKDLQKRSINKLLSENKIIDNMQISFGDSENTIRNEKSLNELKEKIRNIDINNNTPIEIVNKLNILQKEIENV